MRDRILFLFMGAGSVGSLFGGLIAKKSFNVILIGRKNHVDQINKNGLKIKGLINEEIHLPAFKDISSANIYLKENNIKIDFIFITTKAHQTKEAAEQLKKIIKTKTTLIAMQNGIGTEEVIKTILPNNMVLRGITTIGVSKPKPSIIDFTGDGRTLIGYHSEKEKDVAYTVANIMRKSRINCFIEPNIIGAVFTKTIVNCALNPLAALFGVKNKEIFRRKHLREKAILLANEAWNVSKKMGIKLLTENPIELTFDIIKETGDNINSMLSDIQNKRKTEIDFLNGKIISLGLKLGVDVSNNQEIYEKIIDLTKTFR